MIRDSGHFEYDENLKDYYNYLAFISTRKFVTMSFNSGDIMLQLILT